MSQNADRPANRLDRRAVAVTRRGALAAAGVALAGCSEVSNAFGPRYTEEDVSMWLTAECADDGDGTVAVSLAWEWASGDGGTDPRDAALIYWDSRKWTFVDTTTGETVEFETRAGNGGGVGVRFRHDDGAADASTRYHATVTLNPAGDFDPSTRNVYGEFVHVRDQANGTSDEGWFGDLDTEWDVAEANSEAGRACLEEES
jgi:hypothetical protein